MFRFLTTQPRYRDTPIAHKEFQFSIVLPPKLLPQHSIREMHDTIAFTVVCPVKPDVIFCSTKQTPVFRLVRETRPLPLTPSALEAIRIGRLHGILPCPHISIFWVNKWYCPSKRLYLTPLSEDYFPTISSHETFAGAWRNGTTVLIHGQSIRT